MPYGNNLDRWFFVYFGYSFSQKKAFAYVKFTEKDEVLYWNNLWHMIPKTFQAFVGKDPFYPAFNGETKGFTFAVGQGAYREGKMEELYEATDIKCNAQGQRLSSPVLILGKVPRKSSAKENGQKVIEVPKEEAEKLEEYGYWMWARF